MKFGIVYKHSFIYDLLLWILYKGNPSERFMKVADEIPPGSSVLDLCAGTDFLYRQIKNKIASYKALDINPHFVGKLKDLGIDAEIADVITVDYPESDIIVMNSSLYHFGPDASQIINKMLKHARHKVIILEPIKNNSASKFSFLAKFSRWSSSVNGFVPTFHFNFESFNNTFKTYGDKLEKITLISNGRDALAVLKKNE